jgi:hypothetical protein
MATRMAQRPGPHAPAFLRAVHHWRADSLYRFFVHMRDGVCPSRGEAREADQAGAALAEALEALEALDALDAADAAIFTHAAVRRQGCRAAYAGTAMETVYAGLLTRYDGDGR